jgi:hypothetical protein
MRQEARQDAFRDHPKLPRCEFPTRAPSPRRGGHYPSGWRLIGSTDRSRLLGSNRPRQSGPNFRPLCSAEALGIGLRPCVRQAVDSTSTVGRKLRAERGFGLQNEIGRGSGGGLCWRAPRQGIPCRKLIPMSKRGGHNPPRVLSGRGHRNGFPYTSKNSTSLASTVAPFLPVYSGFRTRPESSKPAPNAAALDCRPLQ